MSDLVQRLRQWADHYWQHALVLSNMRSPETDNDCGRTTVVLRQAADEIERLRKDDERQACQPDGLKFDAFGEPRTRYVRVTLDGSHCIMHPSEGDRYLQDARDADDSAIDRYIVRDVWLSEREFDDLPEFDGF